MIRDDEFDDIGEILVSPPEVALSTGKLGFDQSREGNDRQAFLLGYNSGLSGIGKHDVRMPSCSLAGDKKLEVKPPEPLFETSTFIGNNVTRAWRQQYDVSADGKRFLLLNIVQAQTPPPVTIFSNWQGLVKR